MRSLGLVFCVALSLASISFAAEQPKSRQIFVSEVQKMTKQFFTSSQEDISAMLEMFIQTPEVVSVLDGVLTRGINAIRDDENSSLGMKYQWDLGAIEVVSLGSDYAVSVVPFSRTRTDSMGIPTTQELGVSTLIWQKTKSGWRIIHEHQSTKRP